MTARLLIGDVFERMAELENGSVDLLLTSPPFLALRSYLPADHPDKAKEIGSEPMPAAFLDTLLRLTAEWRRLLAPHGSICVELGDTYSGSGGAGGDYAEGGMRENQPGGWKQANARRDKEQMPDGRARTGRTMTAEWPLPKSLCGIPHLYHLSLAYGRNLLTGQPSPAGQWRVRNVVAWCRPNPPVGALGDKFRPATSYLTIACVSGQRYFDLDSCRSTGPALSAVPSVADATEVPTTLLAGDDPAPRGWCDPGRSKCAIGAAMTWEAKRLEVVEPVGFLVGVEQIEGPQVMDLEAAGRPADPALVPIAVERILAGAVPVASSVSGSTSVPTGVVLASDVDAPPLTSTLEAAEVVSQDLALVAGQWLVARITLHLDGACRTAFAIAPVTSASHSEQSNSKYPTSGNGAPPLDWWEIPTQPYPGAHYATWPAALCTRPILAMCPQRVCTICGAPSRRITEVTQSVVTHGHYWDRDEPGQRLESKVGNWKGRRQEDADRNEKPSHHQGFVRHSETLGWTDCGHDTWRNGLVLDPFVGSGTTLAVATGHGRDAIGIDLDERNADLCAARVGMFLEVDGDEEPRPVETVPLDP